MSSDPHAITKAEQLREVVGDPMDLVVQKVFDRIDGQLAEFLERAPFVVVSTSDAEGRQDASPKGDRPGFAELVDAKTLLIPDRIGNKLAMGHENILVNPHVGLLFLVPGTRETLRINGRAELTRDPEVLDRLSPGKERAQLAIRVHVEEAFFHCAKAFVRSKLWVTESWPERVKVSFGRQLADKIGAGDDLAKVIDETVDKGVAELEASV